MCPRRWCRRWWTISWCCWTVPRPPACRRRSDGRQQPWSAVSVVGVDLGGTKVAAASLADQKPGDPVLRMPRLETSQELVDQLAGLVEVARQPGLEAVGV